MLQKQAMISLPKHLQNILRRSCLTAIPDLTETMQINA